MKMLKTFMTISLVAVASMAFSQAQFAIGIKGGPNFSKIDTEAPIGTTYKSRTGFHAGAFMLVKLTKIGIQPELLFSQQGSTVKISSQDLRSSYSYLNIPIILKLYTVAGLNLQLGPQFGFVTSAKQEVPDINGKITEQDVKNSLKGSDIALAIGAGWDLPFGMTIDGRYNLGLSKINNTAGSQEAKNQVWQISLGFKLIKMGK